MKAFFWTHLFDPLLSKVVQRFFCLKPLKSKDLSNIWPTLNVNVYFFSKVVKGKQPLTLQSIEFNPLTRSIALICIRERLKKKYFKVNHWFTLVRPPPLSKSEPPYFGFSTPIPKKSSNPWCTKLRVSKCHNHHNWQLCKIFPSLGVIFQVELLLRFLLLSRFTHFLE